MRYGKWKLLNKDPIKKNYIICKCQCGNIKSVLKYDLRDGKSKSCGCLKTKKCKIRRRYGNLTVLGETILKYDSGTTYLCKCDCGTLTISNAKKLLNGSKKSCGCAKISAAIEVGKSRTIPRPKDKTYEFIRSSRLLDGYVKKLIKGTSKILKNSDLPKIMVETKKLQILLHRESKNGQE